MVNSRSNPSGINERPVPCSELMSLRENMLAAVINEPKDYENLLDRIPAGVKFLRAGKQLDFVHLFATKETELRRLFIKAVKLIKKEGMIWVSWPKGSSKIEKDLNENIVRKIGLAAGLVDIKVCAVDEDWSGLKFVYRLKDRS